MIRISDKWLSGTRGSVAEVLAFFDRFPPNRRADSEAIVRRAFDLCHAAKMDFSLAISRIADETGSLDGPAFFVSDIYTSRLNIGGLGVTDDEDEGISFTDPVKAADAYMAHLFTYVLGDSYNVLGVTPDTDLRFEATPAEWRGSVTTLDDLRGKWFSNPDGAINSAARGNAIFAGIPDQQDGPPIYPETRIPIPTGATSIEIPGVGTVMLRSNVPDRFVATNEGVFRTAPALDAPQATNTGYQTGGTYTFPFRAGVEGKNWLASRFGSWAPAADFDRITG